jgi:hypothetical protein
MHPRHPAVQLRKPRHSRERPELPATAREYFGLDLIEETLPVLFIRLANE